ncbi:hypothetical protein [Streptomyces sp. NPDC047028]|uniref:hypothetical protein n=1 Tax=Streptomyces sp. NPDC047028 TaxID=3155793 RepID=UPI0033C535B7
MSVEIVLTAGVVALLVTAILAIAAVVMVKAVLAVAAAGEAPVVNALLAIAEIIRAIGGKKERDGTSRRTNSKKNAG